MTIKVKIVKFFFAITICAAFYFYDTKKVCSYFAYPCLKLYAYTQGIKYKTKQKLYNQLHQLQDINNNLRKNNCKLASTLFYINETKTIRQFCKRYENISLSSVQILARCLSDQEQYFLIDAGQKNGIKECMVVIHYNSLVGIITEVYPQYAKVRLITDKNSAIGSCCHKTGISGVVSGVNSAHSLVLSHVSHIKKISVGDMVYTSARGTLVPAGFALGAIARVKTGELYHDIVLVSAVDLKKIKYCSVLAST